MLASTHTRRMEEDQTLDELRFEGRTAVVTGAGRGVGRAHALLLAARGANVVVADLGGTLAGDGSDVGPALEVVDEITNAGGSAVACHASVAEEAGAASIVDTAIDAFGSIDIVVNNAGIAAPDDFGDISPDGFRRMIEVHYLGSVYVVQAAWPHMVSAGYGRIVNTCSEAAFGGVPKSVPYAAAKGAVLSFTRALALEAHAHGILVNAVAPRAQTRLSGPDIMAKTYGVPVEMFADGSLTAQFKPELVSPAMAYLAHEVCDLRGEVLIAGGGQVMRLALLQNEGVSSETLTPEVVAGSLDRVLDMTGAPELTVTPLAGEAVQAAMDQASS